MCNRPSIVRAQTRRDGIELIFCFLGLTTSKGYPEFICDLNYIDTATEIIAPKIFKIQAGITRRMCKVGARGNRTIDLTDGKRISLFFIGIHARKQTTGDVIADAGESACSKQSRR